MTAPFRDDPTEPQQTSASSAPDFSRLPYAQVEFLPALQSATGKQFPAPGEELESADGLQFLVDLCAANGVHVAPPLTLPRVLGTVCYYSQYLQCCGFVSGIRCFFDPLIRYPGWKKIRVRDNIPDHFSQTVFRSENT